MNGISAIAPLPSDLAPVKPMAALAAERLAAGNAAKGTDAASAAGAPAAAKAEAQLKSVLADFESVFLNLLWKQLRATLPQGGLLGTSLSHQMFRTMLDEQLSVEMSKAGGIGLAQMMYRQMAPQVLSQSSQSPGRLV